MVIMYNITLYRKQFIVWWPFMWFPTFLWTWLLHFEKLRNTWICSKADFIHGQNPRTLINWSSVTWSFCNRFKQKNYNEYLHTYYCKKRVPIWRFKIPDCFCNIILEGRLEIFDVEHFIIFNDLCQSKILPKTFDAKYYDPI